MKITIDASGRIVVPKALRDGLGFAPGQSLDIWASDGRLVIELAPTPMSLKKRGKGQVAVPETNCPRSPPSRFATRWNACGVESG
jgi:AbrB family looped-hinge helix DNA binding protein